MSFFGFPTRTTGPSFGQDVKQIKDDIKGMKDDIRGMKEDIKHLVEQTGTGRVLQYLQQSPAPSTSRQGENTDMMSDTASTLSTGSEDDYGIRTRCFSDAVESHFLEIIRNVPFVVITDRVVDKHVVTVQESQRISSLTSDEDKMRSLVLITMNKGYDTITQFVNLIGECDEILKESILNTFSDRYRGQPPNRVLKCTVCAIKSKADIKDVCDHMITRHLISRELHREVTLSQTSKEGEALWQRVFYELSKERSEYILNVFKEILSDGEGETVSHYDYIITKIEKDIEKRRRFKCRCSTNRKRHISPFSPRTVPPKFKSAKSSLEPQPGVSNIKRKKDF